VEKVLRIKEGVVTNWMILIPPGHLALARTRVLYGLEPLLPSEENQWIRGNAESLNFPDFFDPPEQPYTLRFQGWNEDTAWDHTFYFRVVVMPRKLAYLHEAFLRRQAELVGKAVTQALMRAWEIV